MSGSCRAIQMQRSSDAWWHPQASLKLKGLHLLECWFRLTDKKNLLIIRAAVQQWKGTLEERGSLVHGGTRAEAQWVSTVKGEYLLPGTEGPHRCFLDGPEDCVSLHTQSLGVGLEALAPCRSFQKLLSSDPVLQNSSFLHPRSSPGFNTFEMGPVYSNIKPRLRARTSKTLGVPSNMMISMLPG